MTLLSQHEFRPSADKPRECAYCGRRPETHIALRCTHCGTPLNAAAGCCGKCGELFGGTHP